MNNNQHPRPLPADLKAPEGCVILGWGGTFRVPRGPFLQENRFWGMELLKGGIWGYGAFLGDDPALIYAAAADSEVVRINTPIPDRREMAHGEPETVRETPRVDSLAEDVRGTDQYLGHPRLWGLARILERELAANDALIGELKDYLQRIDKKCNDGNEDAWTIVAKVGDLAIEALRRAEQGKEGYKA